MILEGKTVLVTGVGKASAASVRPAPCGTGPTWWWRPAPRNPGRHGRRAGPERPSVSPPTSPTSPTPTRAPPWSSAAQDRFGSVDALIQVAAYENVWGGLYDLRFESWRKAFETNVLGALTVIRPVAEAMKAGGGGSVVLIGSQSMFQPALPQSGYAASKGALLSAMYYLVDELGPDNIRLNMVIPSWMWGPNVEMYVTGTANSTGVAARGGPRRHRRRASRCGG